MTTSNQRPSGSNCETTSGDIAQHGRSAPRTCGAAWKSWRDRQVTPFEPGLMLDDVGFPGVGVPGTRGILGYGSPYAHGRATDVVAVGCGELRDGAEMSRSIESPDARVREHDGLEDR